MKKIIVGGISFLCCFLMFAEKNLYGKENCERVIPKIQTLSSDLEDSKNELGDSIKNFTETANESTIVTYSNNLQNDYGMNYFQDEIMCSSEKFANAIIKAQNNGQIIDLTV